MGIAGAYGRWGLLVATCIGVAGCATAYRIPPETIALRRGLDQSRALAIVDQSARGKKGAGAGVYLVYLPAMKMPIYPRVEGHHVAFDISGPDLSPSSEPDVGCRVPTGELIAVGREVPTLCTMAFDLRQIQKVIVLASEGDAPSSGAIRPLAPGYSVSAFQTLTSGMVFNVPANELSPLVAALTFLSPTARVVAGAGF